MCMNVRSTANTTDCVRVGQVTSISQPTAQMIICVSPVAQIPATYIDYNTALMKCNSTVAN